MANNTIKGLTIEIGGDTTKLGKALDDVDKKSANLSRELGQINKMLKMDPGNAELLAQKQKVLAEAVETTSEKLRTLREAEKQVQKQFERGEVSEEQVRALQREVITTAKKLDTYEKAAEETAKAVEELGDSSADVKDGTKKAEKGADEAADALDELSRSADKAERSSGKMGSALAGAAAKGLSAVAGAATAAAGAMTAATVNAAGTADEILTLSSVTGVSTEDLQAFSYAAGLVDVDLETMTKSMAKNIKSMSSAQQGSAQYAEAYKKIGVSVTDANGNLRDGETVYWEAIDALGKMTNETERDAVAMQLFGKSAQELNPLIEAGSGKMKELTKEAKEVGAVMSEDTLDALGSFDDSMERLKGSAGAAKNALGSVLLPELQMLTDAGTGLLADFTTNLNASGGGLDGFLETIDGMQGQIIEVLTTLATQLVEKVASLAPKLVEVGISLVSSLATSIISMVPTLIETAFQIGLAVLNGITQAIPQIVTTLADMIPKMVQALVTGIPQMIEGAVQLLLAIVDAIPQLLPPLIEAIPQIVMCIIDALLGAIPQLLDGALQLLLAVVDAIPLLVRALVPAIPDIVTTIVLGLMDCIPDLLNAAVTLLLAIVEAIPQICVELIKALPQIWKTMSSYFKQLPGKLWEILKSLVSNFARWGTESRQKMREGAQNIISAVVSLFGQLPGKIWTWLSNAASKVVAWGSSLVSKAKSAVKRMVDTVVNTVKSLPSKMLTAGKNLVQGLWKGINGAYTWLKDKIRGWVGNVTDFLKGLFGIKSPSRVTAYMGEMLDKGLAVGIEDNTDAPMRAMRDMTEEVLGGDPDGLTLTRQINRSHGAGAAPVLSGADVLGKLDSILQAIQAGQVIALDGKTLIGSTAAGYDSTLGQRRALAARGAL